jgi:topoisomerase IV subunit A
MIAEFSLSDRQAEAILNMRLRSLRKLEEMEIGREREALAKEREELAKLLESPARQRTRLKKDLQSVKAKFGDERRTRIEESAAPREIDWSAMIEKEPITVILSQRGWIRAMKGHVDLGEIDQLKWREGDGPFVSFHAQTTDRLALFAGNGRVYTLSGDKLPGGRGFGEPVRLQIDLDPEVEIVTLLVVAPGMKLLVASSDGRGFITSGESTLAETRKGKQLVNLKPKARLVGRAAGAGKRGFGRGGRRKPQVARFRAGRSSRACERAGRDASALSRRRPFRCSCLSHVRRAQLEPGGR